MTYYPIRSILQSHGGLFQRPNRLLQLESHCCPLLTTIESDADSVLRAFEKHLKRHRVRRSPFHFSRLVRIRRSEALYNCLFLIWYLDCIVRNCATNSDRNSSAGDIFQAMQHAVGKLVWRPEDCQLVAYNSESTVR